MKVLRFFFVSIVILSLVSCGRNYNIEKPSPTGEYRVKVDVHVEEENDLLGHFTESGKIQVFKGQGVIYAHEWKVRDNWDTTFIGANPVIEWVGDNVLRMGLDRSKESLSNQLVISNKTDESLKQMSVSCGKYESFYIFSLPPHSQVTLYPAPELNPDVSGNYSFGYAGEALNGKSFSGVLRHQKPAAGNSVRMEITVNDQDLKK